MVLIRSAATFSYATALANHKYEPIPMSTNSLTRYFGVVGSHWARFAENFDTDCPGGSEGSEDYSSRLSGLLDTR